VGVFSFIETAKPGDFINIAQSHKGICPHD